MNDYNDIAQLYKAYCSVPAEQYWYILTLHSRPEEYKKLRRILFPPKISEDEIKRREALLYLYLWDLLFYNKYSNILTMILIIFVRLHTTIKNIQRKVL